MTDLDIFCNFKKCRKRLNVTAWVTSCSHAFCEEDGSRVFSNENENTCPACNTCLPNKYDVVKVDMNPSQQFRSMVLTGLRPEIVIDIAHRAISFWNYQIYMEQIYQKKCNESSRESISQLEQYYETLVTKLKTQLQVFNRKVENMKKEMQIQTEREAKLIDRINEKQRENNDIQVMYESLKRTQLNFMKDHQEHNSKQKRIKPPTEKNKYTVGPRTLEEVMYNGPTASATHLQTKPQPEGNFQGFDFKPITPSPTMKKKFTDSIHVRKKQKLFANQSLY